VYLVQWQELSLELAEIYGEIFESNYELIRLGQKKVRVKDIDEINSRGEKCVYYYQDIIDYLVNEYNKEKEKNVDDFVTIITIKSNMARIISKLIYQKNVKKKVDAMKESLKLYMEVKDMLVNSPGLLKEHEELKENLKMCEEMVQMLPVKIDKINRGEEFN
jgi:hypothetical protein